MTHAEAVALEQWVKDHDTRFEAKATAENARHGVQLTSPEDGTQIPMIYHIEDYGRQHIEQGNASPTVREKWASWRGKSGRGGAAAEQG